MVFMPFNFLLQWLTGLLSVALLGGGIYIIHEWHERDLLDRNWLILGVAIVIWSFIGFLPISMLLRRPGNDEPTGDRSPEAQRLVRPDGSEIHVEFYGPPDAQPIIMTHGWGPNSTVWYYAKKQLSQRFRLILW